MIGLWLGHERTNTIHRYVETDPALKKKVLARLDAPDKPSCGGRAGAQLRHRQRARPVHSHSGELGDDAERQPPTGVQIQRVAKGFRKASGNSWAIARGFQRESGPEPKPFKSSVAVAFLPDLAEDEPNTAVVRNTARHLRDASTRRPNRQRVRIPLKAVPEGVHVEPFDNEPFRRLGLKA